MPESALAAASVGGFAGGAGGDSRQLDIATAMGVVVAESSFAMRWQRLLQ